MKIKSIFRIFLYTLALSFLSVVQSSFAEDWLGVFTTDTYPVDGCKVVRAGNLIQISEHFGAGQREDWNNEKNFIKKLDSSIMNCIDDFTKHAKSSGYNAIVGYKVIVSPMYEGFGGSIINGLAGFGYGVVVGQGVPVVVKCGK